MLCAFTYKREGETVNVDSCDTGRSRTDWKCCCCPNGRAIWLYGGDLESVEQTVRYARFGVMPPWGERLTEAEIKAVTAYVHQLGGGE